MLVTLLLPDWILGGILIGILCYICEYTFSPSPPVTATVTKDYDIFQDFNDFLGWGFVGGTIGLCLGVLLLPFSYFM